MILRSPWMWERTLETEVCWITLPQTPVCLRLSVSDPFCRQEPLLSGFFGDAEDQPVLVCKWEGAEPPAFTAALAPSLGSLAVCIESFTLTPVRSCGKILSLCEKASLIKITSKNSFPVCRATCPACKRGLVLCSHGLLISPPMRPRN